MKTVIKPVAVAVMLLFAGATFAQAGAHHYKHHKHHKRHHVAHHANGRRPALPPPPPHP